MNFLTVDISKTVYEAAREAAPQKAGVFIKALSGNKVRVDLCAADYHHFHEIAETLALHPAGDTKLARANQRRAALACTKALEAAGRPEEAAKDAPAKDAPANPSTTTYASLQRAFDHFNETLFDNRLPPVMLVIHRKRNAHGYFWNGMWSDGNGGEMSEIALNPESMGRGPKEVLSTLAHEMVHHEQQVFGKPSKTGHNVEWCQWMERIGLTPVGMGNCAGKRSGRNFSHEIVEGGQFDIAADAVLAMDDVDLSWFSKAQRKGRKQDFSKVKHQCGCGTNVWGKYNPDTGQGVNVYCDDCGENFRPVLYL